MLIFLDTEFTDFLHIDLISLALVPEDESLVPALYLERIDYAKEDCNDFVRAAVEPLLGQDTSVQCSRAEMANRVLVWFEALPEPATILFDYYADWELLADLLHETPQRSWLEGVLQLRVAPECQSAFFTAQNLYFARGLSRHHALHDARALREAFRAIAS